MSRGEPGHLFRDLVHARDRRHPLVIAHRGASARAPENTLDAARLGWEAGADAWELDVHLTRDGVPVVLHDESLVRTTDVARRFATDPRASNGFLVSDFDLDEVQSLDAGSWFVATAGGARTAAAFGTLDALDDPQRTRFASGKVRVPTLEEALRLTVELDWCVNVELKSFPNSSAAMLGAVLEVVDRVGAAARVLFSSFDHADVAAAAQKRPDIASGVLAAHPVHLPHEYVRNFVGADCYHPSSDVLGAESDAYRRAPSAQTLRLSDLQALSDAGIPVLVFTVNPTGRGSLAAHLADAGVAGLFTDDPGPMRRFFSGS